MNNTTELKANLWHLRRQLISTLTIIEDALDLEPHERSLATKAEKRARKEYESIFSNGIVLLSDS